MSIVVHLQDLQVTSIVHYMTTSTCHDVLLLMFRGFRGFVCGLIRRKGAGGHIRTGRQAGRGVRGAAGPGGGNAARRTPLFWTCLCRCVQVHFSQEFLVIYWTNDLQILQLLVLAPSAVWEGYISCIPYVNKCFNPYPKLTSAP